MTDEPSFAFDVGGTFTDVVALRRDGTLGIDKIPSDRQLVRDVRKLAQDSLQEAGSGPRGRILHGTTIASNALLEGNGPIIGVVTTQGFRDELEIRREARPSVFDFDWQRTPPLILRRRRFEVTERIDARGTVVLPLNEQETADALQALAEQGAAAIAICFINSYMNPAHERAAKAIARRILPDALICASHEILPQAREYERLSTTCVNTYLLPVVLDYFAEIEAELAGLPRGIQIMQSNGGTMTLDQARTTPVRLIESGPAGGVIAAAELAREMRIEGVVSFDMGGTTAKACLIEDGEPVERLEYEVGGRANFSARHDRGFGYAVAVPSFDIVEVGAGGGSLARFEDGALRVGPESAGAIPGPVAYQRGGKEPTVTDANVALGLIRAESIAGGAIRIDRPASCSAIDRVLGTHMRRPTMEIAHGIFQVANAVMMRAIRAVTTERGRDPRSYVLVAFGGSGPVHAAALADLLGMRRVIVPALAGLFSAVGLLVAKLRYDEVTTCSAHLDDRRVSELLDAGFRTLSEQLRERIVRDGLDLDALAIERSVDLRYAGQSSEIPLRMPGAREVSSIAASLKHEFHARHEQLYGYRRETEPVYVQNIRLRAIARRSATSLRDIGTQLWQIHSDGRGPSHRAGASRRAYFGPERGELDAQVVTRAKLRDRECLGPAIVDEFSTTVVIPPGWMASADDLANIVLERA